MRITTIVTVFLVTVACSVISCNRTEHRKELIVSAAISLKNAMEEVREIFQQKHSVTIILNFGSSGSLRQQISKGAPVDIFFSAAEKQMNELEAEGLILEGTRTPLLSNSLVLISGKRETTVTTIRDLEKQYVETIAIGDPKSVPVGSYTVEALSALGMEPIVAQKAVFAKDVRQVLAYVETGNATAGFVYLTDTKNANVRIVEHIADSLHSPIRYPVAVLKRTHYHDEARAFIAFLSSDTAMSIFQKFGFLQNAR